MHFDDALQLYYYHYYYYCVYDTDDPTADSPPSLFNDLLSLQTITKLPDKSQIEGDQDKQRSREFLQVGAPTFQEILRKLQMTEKKMMMRFQCKKDP